VNELACSCHSGVQEWSDSTVQSSSVDHCCILILYPFCVLSAVMLPCVNLEKTVLTKTFESSGGVFDASAAGVTISIPPGAVPSGVIATVSVKLFSSSSFQFPEDCELVSPIYFVETNKNFLKPVELVISHDAGLQSEEDCKSVVILTASIVPDYRGSTPSYPFRKASGGIFEVGRRTGRFTVTQLGFFAAVGHHAGTLPPSQRYSIVCKECVPSLCLQHSCSLCCVCALTFCASMCDVQFGHTHPSGSRLCYLNGPVKISIRLSLSRWFNGRRHHIFVE